MIKPEIAELKIIKDRFTVAQREITQLQNENARLQTEHKAELEKLLDKFELRRFDIAGLLWVLTDKQYQALKASVSQNSG